MIYGGGGLEATADADGRGNPCDGVLSTGDADCCGRCNEQCDMARLVCMERQSD